MAEPSVPRSASKPEARLDAPAPRADRTLDIRGQVCPLTFVRAKLAIEAMALGEVLEIVVDHEPAAENVPRSMRHEGQAVLAVQRAGEREWRLFVRKERERGR
jgi:TusA-related sulfurtransferase